MATVSITFAIITALLNYSASVLTFYSKHAFRDTYSFHLHENNRTNLFLPNFKPINIFTIQIKFFKLSIAHYRLTLFSSTAGLLKPGPCESICNYFIFVDKILEFLDFSEFEMLNKMVLFLGVPEQGLTVKINVF